MKLIENEWQSYVTKVIPNVDPNSVQFSETKKAFFGGIFSLRSILFSAPDDEAESEAILVSIDEELNTFLDQIKDSAKPLKAIRKQVAKDTLRCQATGYDDEASRNVFSVLTGKWYDVGVSIYNAFVSAGCPRESAVQLSILFTGRIIDSLPENAT